MPRSVDMIGSLVVIFPTAHKGGALILCHGGQEYTFDSGLKLSHVEKPSIMYVAYVEHEVTIIESGYHLSLTYNLYVSPLLSGKTFHAYLRTVSCLMNSN